MPCAALGLVEVAGRQKGFLALKPTKEFSSTTGQNGFELGTELLGNPKVYILHLILNFDNDHVYDVFLNLTSPVVKTVLKVWKETNDHFFFVFNGAGFVAFDQILSEAWYKHNLFEMIEKATNTVSQYEKAVDDVKHIVHGQHYLILGQN